MEKSIFQLIVDTLKRHEKIWKAMYKSEQIFDVLIKKNDSLRDKRSTTELCIVKYLLKSLQENDNEKRAKVFI